jgi:PAS domain S-box-containing protein
MTLPTGRAVFFDSDDMIVSKTNLKGHLTYANDIFQKISGYTEAELIGKPHSIIRHPDMPRCVFKLLWDTIQSGTEIFAYVVNLAKNGDHYWVLAHVTPSYDATGNIVGYHSARRVPNHRTVQEVIVPLYRDLLRIENEHANRKEGMNASFQKLFDILTEKNVHYDELVASLARAA